MKEEKVGLQRYADARIYRNKQRKLKYKSFLVSPKGNLIGEMASISNMPKTQPTQQNWSAIIIWGLLIWGSMIWGWHLYSNYHKKRQEKLNAEQRERERKAEETRRTRKQKEMNGHRYHEKQKKEDSRKQEGWRVYRDQEGHKTPHEILGVSTITTVEEIRSAYKKKALENHPDRTTGLGEEYRQLAEKRMKEINVAYEKLRNRKT
jgi:hypothetical protein